jgi:predicted transcriptional regulator
MKGIAIMAREVRQRIVRPATPEEAERHTVIRKQIEEELPEIEQWARDAAARHRERVAVGTVLTAEENNVLEAIDDYAAKHSLTSRSAVIREALANLLGIEIARQ